MLVKKKRTEITIETETVIAIRTAPSSVAGRCSECEGGQVMLTAVAAARTAGLNTRAIYRLVETGELHAADTTDGQLLVCQTSLATYLERDTR